ncbi:TetR/AcrR family transcriptional regulator [Pelagicoccus sp. SDUM812003]|uniref:TetR/AcrR family transcriptional regulator n=1 Tax=Pelagicoccus sp. SDUM812003 TaxID=3041267 RepID=UPI002810286A|nr:TetR/AcrR family transcriptional regulator [Pelagicoccus sp. SDUM812003]MDQ8204365.1 TetR/AcrR family transcriptional regulator [Pelagicoccus sp. SDUM812003]
MNVHSVSVYSLEMEGKREIQKRRTRERIVEHALRAFVDNGIETTNTARIATAAGLSHGAIFVHFKTRQEVVMSVVEAFGAELSERIEACVGRRQRLRSILLAFVEALKPYERFYTELLQISSKLPKGVQGSLLMLQNGFSYFLLPAVEREVGKGRFERLKEAGVVNSWFALLHYYLMNRDWYVEQGGVLEELGPRIIDEYLALIDVEGT